MEDVKKPVCILLFLCSAAMACNRENPVPRNLGDLSGADPVDLLRALDTATGFERALVLERLGLTKEAIAAFDAVVREGAEGAEEAREHLDRLQKAHDPVRQWLEIDAALERRDRPALTRIARAFPADASRYCEQRATDDLDGARLFAEVLAAQGERYPQAIVEAMDGTKDRMALEQGLLAIEKKDGRRAVALMERAGNPLALTLRCSLATQLSTPAEESVRLLDATIPQLKPEYRELRSRMQTTRAWALEYQSNYLAAHAAYDNALRFAQDDPTLTAEALCRRSLNYRTLGSHEKAFRDAHRALSLLDRIANTNARHQSYAAAATAARALGRPILALHYQNAAVDELKNAVARAPDKNKQHLAIALRGRAEIHVELGRDSDAATDLTQASELADAAGRPHLRAELQMRLHEVRGQWLSSESELTRAIELATAQDSTYRAVLHHKRAAVRRKNGDLAGANEDLDTAVGILREEAKGLVDVAKRGEYEELWTAYFRRFESMHHEIIESHLAANDVERAFVYAELARALEPMQILLQSRIAPAGFGPIETKADLARYLDNLPDDTAILQYVVMAEKTYTWVLTRGEIVVVPQRAKKSDIEKLVRDAIDAATSQRPDSFKRTMREAYTELFRAPLALVSSKTRIVIVPDGPMHGLPFAGLQGTTQEGHLIDRASITVAASTSLYSYALARDRQFSSQQNPPVLLVGDPEIAPGIDLERLEYAQAEVNELAGAYYRGAEVLTGAEATVSRFLAGARSAGIIHFAGHAIASPRTPWQSRLVLAPEGNKSGELTAETLMKELSELERTRLVVLGACSTAGGQSVGPEGLAPLVRPLIAANVPAVVGTIWDVKDATTKELLVSLHCHYRHGDDVAVALQKAQREMLRKQPRAMTWAAFQVVGHAGSPYPRPIASEEPDSERVCTQDSLQRPDGLHPQ